MEPKTYPSFEAAWAAVAGTLPVPPDLAAPSGNWTVCIEESQQESSVSASGGHSLPVAIRGILEGEANRVARRAVITPGDPVPVPAVEDAPAALAHGSVFVLLIQGALKARAATRAGLDCRWIREVAAGTFTGDFSAALDAAAEAALEVAFSGDFTAVLAGEDGQMRLRVFRRSGPGWFSAGVRVAAEAQAQAPENLEDLVRALLGVHETQWLRALAGEYGAVIAAKLRIARETLARALEFWRSLDSGLAAVVWKAIADRAAAEQIRDWLGRIAQLDDRARFNAALREALEAAPDFVRSPVASCIDAVAGSLLAAVTSEDAWLRVQRAACRANAFLSEPGVAEALASLREYASRELGIDRVEAALSDPAAAVDDWLRGRVAEALGSSSAAAAIGAALALARRVCSEAASAAAKKLAAELNWRSERSWRDEALIDCTFAPAGEGMEIYRRAIAGDAGALFEAALAGKVRAREAVLTHGIAGETRIELQLPFFRRSEWRSRWESLATARIEAGESGRVLVYTAEASDRIEKRNLHQSALLMTGAVTETAARASFHLSYSDARTLRRAEARAQLEPLIAAYRFDACALDWIEAAGADAIEASLTLSACEDVVAAWMRAPRERDAEYFRACAAMSVAVQRALRVWLPYAYFSDLRQYENLGAAWPLLLYQCTQPFPGRPPHAFTYDVMDAAAMRAARQTALSALAPEMRRVGNALAAANRGRAASFYREMQPAALVSAVERRPVGFKALLSADAFFVNALVDLGRKGREAAAGMSSQPQRAVRRLAGFAADFTKTFHRRLRRLYGGESFPAFGMLLLAEAANGLAGVLGPGPKLAGVLRLKAGNAEQVFTNDGFGA